MKRFLSFIIKIVEKYDNGKLKFVGDYCNCKRWNGNIYNYIGTKI